MNKVLATLSVAVLLTVPALAQADWKKGDNGLHKGWYKHDWKDHKNDHDHDYHSRYDNDHRYSYNNYNYNHYNGPSYFSSPFQQQSAFAMSRGTESGRLSSREVWELRDKQREIQNREAAYRRDGYLSGSERDKLNDDIRDYWKKYDHEYNDGERQW